MRKHDDYYINQRREFDTEEDWQRHCLKMGYDPDDPDHHRPLEDDNDEEDEEPVQPKKR